MNRLLWVFITTIVVACACVGNEDTADQDAGDSVGDDDTQVCCAAAPICAPGEETFHTLQACEEAGGKCTENSLCCSTVYCRSSDRPSGDGGIADQDAGDGAVDDYPLGTCTGVPSCGPGEEAYWTPEACEAAGGECTSYSVCDSTVYCRPSVCKATIVYDVWGCRRGDYCTPLPSGEYCTGHRDGCSEWSWPITLPKDEACPEDLYCESKLPDGRWCVHYEFESVNDCMNTGDYATPQIGTIVPCNPGDTALGLVAGFELSLCCLDTTPSNPGCEADATPVGDCEKFLGWGWDGEVCGAWSGCSCEGEGCDDLYDSKDECNEAQQARNCLPPDCRTIGCDEGYTCDATCYSDYTCVPDGTFC